MAFDFASIASTGLSLAGGFGGKKKRGPSFEDQLVQASRVEKGRVNTAMELSKEYGIHPSILLGGGASFSSAAPSFSFGSDSNDFSEIGQNVGRAVHAAMPRDERAYTEAAADLSLENMSLQNDLLRTQITSVNRSNVPARDPTSIYEGGVSPHKVGDPSRADLKPMTSWRTLTTPDGREVIVPSPEALTWMEGDLLGTPRWYGDQFVGHLVNAGERFGNWWKSRAMGKRLGTSGDR